LNVRLKTVPSILCFDGAGRETVQEGDGLQPHEHLPAVDGRPLHVVGPDAFRAYLAIGQFCRIEPGIVVGLQERSIERAVTDMNGGVLGRVGGKR
jgi:hypothetical protein